MPKGPMGMMPKHGPWMSRRHHFHKRRFPLIGGPYYPYYTYYVIPRQIAQPQEVWFYAVKEGHGVPDVDPAQKEWVEILVYDQHGNPVFGILRKYGRNIAKVNIIKSGYDNEGNLAVLVRV